MARPKQDLTKHTLFLRRGDMEELQSLYPEVGGSIIIRSLVSKHIDEIKARVPRTEIKPEIHL
jgi:hypothetical protein